MGRCRLRLGNQHCRQQSGRSGDGLGNISLLRVLLLLLARSRRIYLMKPRDYPNVDLLRYLDNDLSGEEFKTSVLIAMRAHSVKCEWKRNVRFPNACAIPAPCTPRPRNSATKFGCPWNGTVLWSGSIPMELVAPHISTDFKLEDIRARRSGGRNEPDCSPERRAKRPRCKLCGNRSSKPQRISQWRVGAGNLDELASSRHCLVWG